jgi:hypothetical protein
MSEFADSDDNKAVWNGPLESAREDRKLFALAGQASAHGTKSTAGLACAFCPMSPTSATGLSRFRVKELVLILTPLRISQPRSAAQG